MKTKHDMFDQGCVLMAQFCQANNLPIPSVITEHKRWPFDVPAYYDKDAISILIHKCSHIGTCGMAWSYPGYTVDKTPYGVIQHEIGHHVDLYNAVEWRQRYYSDFSTKIFDASGEIKLTNYDDGKHEWFAEMFRLFVTNPDLLRLLRPKTYALLLERFKPVELRPWGEVLANAPMRTIEQCHKKIQAAAIPASKFKPSPAPLL